MTGWTPSTVGEWLALVASLVVVGALRRAEQRAATRCQVEGCGCACHGKGAPDVDP